MARKHGHRYEDFTWSVNVPQTRFRRQGREGEVLRYWGRIDLPRLARERGVGRPPFRLHDGPADAHGPLRLEVARNKILKDIQCKFRAMQGYDAVLVPGWDAHGLAAEVLVTRVLKPEVARHPLDVRGRCAQQAAAAIEQQQAALARLGIHAAWEDRYATLQPGYEAAVLRVFGALVEHALIYRAPRPVTWCPQCATVLADAEVELHPQPVDAIHLALPVHAAVEAFRAAADPQRMSAVVYSTAPWTLPGAVAVAVHPDVTYALVIDDADPEGFTYLTARDGVRVMGHTLQMQAPRVLCEATGHELADLRLLNPVSGREMPVVLDPRMTVEPGTGLRAVAPGVDAADFDLAREADLPLLHILDDAGRLRPATGAYAGHTPAEAQRLLLRQLDHDGVLLAHTETHALRPCCWHCRKTAITRVMPHWFLAVAPLRARVLAAAEQIRWQPAWGQARLTALLQERPDWCLSRRRTWGIPLPVVFCTGCHEPLLDPAVIDHIATRVEGEGSDVWFTRPVRDFVPEGTVCPHCGGTGFRKGDETFDAWFGAACSPLAAPDGRDGARPADLALESHDHLRGWLQLALLAGLGAGETLPFTTAATHGFVLPRQMPVARVLAHHGADVLRLWTALADPRADAAWTPASPVQARRALRRLRGTARILLGHLADFHPATMAVPLEALTPIDRWALDRLHAAVTTVTDALDAGLVHRAMQALLACCADLSAAYLPVVHDNLITAAADDPARRATQTTCYILVETLARLLAPLASFTAEEIWRHLPAEVRPPSPLLADWPVADPAWANATLAAAWAAVRVMRAPVHAAVLLARATGTISRAKEAKVLLPIAGELTEAMELFGQHFSRLCGVADIVPAPEGTAITVTRSAGAVCPRCRHCRPVGSVPAWPTLCAECAGTVGTLRLHPAA
jgi:isoleucyl-tRNA synthetase